MKQQLRTVLGLLTFVFGLLLICVMLQFWLSGAEWTWRFVARPPLPPGALFVQTEYPRDLATDGVYRSIRFQSSQSVEEVRQL